MGWAGWILWIGMLPGLVHAGPSDSGYLLDVWQVEQGLPGNSVTTLAKTPEGYLWLGTFGGLVRFDGRTFQVFDDRTPGMPGEAVVDSFVEPGGALWVFLLGGQVARMEKGRFEQFGLAEGWPGQPLRRGAHAREASGAILLLNDLGGVFRFQDGRFARLSPDGDGRGLTQLVEDGRAGGPVWAVSSQRIGFWTAGGWQEFRPAGSPPIDGVTLLVPAREGGVWAHAGERLLRVEAPAGVVETRAYPPRSDPYCLEEDSSGQLWAGTWGRGLLAIRPDGSRLTFDLPDGLPHHVIRCIREDEEGNLWVGTNGGGLARLKRRVFTSFDRMQDFPEPHPVPLTVGEDGQGRLLAGCLDMGLYRLDEGRQFRSLEASNPALALPGVWAFAGGRDGALWVGSRGGGLLRLDRGGLRRWGLAEGLPDRHVLALLEAADGRLWLGTETGLACYDGRQFEFFTTRDGLLAERVHALAEDSRGTLWVGTIDGGLNRRDGGRFLPVTEGLPSRTVDALLADGDGTIWIGTTRGLAAWHGGQVKRVTLANGPGEVAISALVDDRLGHLWLGSNRGVLRVARADLAAFLAGQRSEVDVLAYGKTDGLGSVQISAGQPSGCRLSDGRLAFATSAGVSVVDPTRLARNSPAPPVVIQEVRIDGRVVKDSPGGLAGEVAGGRSGVVRVAPGPRRVEIEYAGLSYTAPERVRCRYRLEGFDPGWRSAGSERVASFQGLPPGSYRFEVEARNPDGVWSRSAAAVTLVFLPTWWQRGWVQLWAAGAVAGWGVWIVRGRWRRLEAARAAQQEFSRRLMDSQEEERQRVAAELHDSVGQNLLVIKNLAQMALKRSEDPRRLAEELGEVSQMASLTLREVRDLAQDLRPFHLDEMGLTRAVQAMVHRLEMASPLRFHLELADLDGSVPPEHEIHLFRLVQESLSNAVRHAQATEVRVRAWRDPGWLRVRVEDNGQGFMVPAPGSPGSASFGLRSLRERARAIGARLSVESRPDQGTTVAVDVPLTGPEKQPTSPP